VRGRRLSVAHSRVTSAFELERPGRTTPAHPRTDRSVGVQPGGSAWRALRSGGPGRRAGAGHRRSAGDPAPAGWGDAWRAGRPQDPARRPMGRGPRRPHRRPTARPPSARSTRAPSPSGADRPAGRPSAVPRCAGRGSPRLGACAGAAHRPLSGPASPCTATTGWATSWLGWRGFAACSTGAGAHGASRGRRLAGAPRLALQRPGRVGGFGVGRALLAAPPRAARR
jgi:hypothetical protein